MNNKKSNSSSSVRVSTKVKTIPKQAGQKQSASPSVIYNPSEKVMLALENPKWQYRTSKGIAKETQIKESIVTEILNQTSMVRRSHLTSSNGSRLYASKNRVSVFEDIWATITTINKAKFGG